jgi:hypothetical protein
MKRILLILVVSNLMFACDLLDKSSLDQVTEDTYWTSSNDLKLYVNQFYPDLGGNLAYYNLDSNSDNLQPVSPSEVLNGTRSIPESGGGWDWSNIREVNYFLANASQVTEGTQSELDQYIGEGHFFRAYFYFQLVKRFGDVPYYDKVLDTDSEGLKAPREPRNVIIDNIISDLDESIALLREKSELSTNRVNRESALLFKSRVALYEGTWEKYHQGTVFGVEGSDGHEYLKIAVQASEKLVNGNYSLYSTGNPGEDYWKLFNRTDLSDNSEVFLFQPVEPEADLGTGNWTYLNGSRGRRTGITKQLVQSYLDSNGKPISESNLYQGDTTLVQTVENRDPRLKQTMWVPGQVQIDYGAEQEIFESPTLNEGSFDLSTTGYMIRKGSTTDPDQNQGSSSANYGATDASVFRYAEALLNYAEAKAELGTLTQADLDNTINLLRERVGMPGLNIKVSYSDDNWNFPNLSSIINEIRRERRIELALEGFRYDDLMRWAAADLFKNRRFKGARFIMGKSFPEIEDEITGIPVDENNYIDRYQNDIPGGFGFNETRDYLYPIPTNELSLNENLTQNPGW